MNNGDRNSLLVHYSPSARYSLGYRLEHKQDGDYTLHALQMNNLLKRWNGRDYQGNFYLKSGLGVARGDHGRLDNESEFAAFAGISADWESRRFFARYENRYTEAGALDDSFAQSARVGVAPYIGDYGDLHTWLMIEVDHRPERDDSITMTPFVRFFKGAHLVEVGVSDRGDVLFNWIIRY